MISLRRRSSADLVEAEMRSPMNLPGDVLLGDVAALPGGGDDKALPDGGYDELSEPARRGSTRRGSARRGSARFGQVMEPIMHPMSNQAAATLQPLGSPACSVKHE
ncbi:hypothetical protein Dimus_016703 [Dionaea muscipula]